MFYNAYAYIAHKKRNALFRQYLVHPERFELTTSCSEDRRSNPLSYGCMRILYHFPLLDFFLVCCEIFVFTLLYLL